MHAATYDGDFEMQENSPRVGVNLIRKIDDEIELIGKLEYAIHITDGINFSNDANTSADFIASPFKKKEAFSSRLSYIGISYKKWGQISIGKQWGVYYDIGSYTDNLLPFGGNSNGIYAGGTDGGWKGTGRADRAIIYRNKIGKLKLGAQTQLFRNTKNHGFSLEYSGSEGLSFGASYNRANIAKSNQSFVQDIGAISNNFLVGIKYQTKKFFIAATYSINDDEILILNDSTAASFPTFGYEFSTNYKVSDNWMLKCGVNLTERKSTSSTFYKDDYKLLHIILGIEYSLSSKTKIYCLGRISNSKYTKYKDKVNAFALGLRYDFNFGKNITNQ